MSAALWISLGAIALQPRMALTQAPQMTGTVDIDLGEGRITGDVCLADLPQAPPYRFALHRALNITQVRTGTGRVLPYDGHYKLQPAGVTLRYTVTDTLGEDRKLCVSYVGRYPVYDTTFNTFDYKENIAFGHGSVRASDDTRWYPVFYDSVADRERASVTYHLHVRCPGCKTIYVNGAAPVSGTEADVSSSRARPLVLYAGDFPATFTNGNWYVGSEISDSAARLFSAKIVDVQRFYEAFLSVPFADTLTFVSFRPVKQMRLGQLWAFVTLPTVALNKDFEVFVNPQYGDAMLSGTFGVLAHELGHYYFGGLLEPAGPYFQFYVESTAEYLALKAIEHEFGQAAYAERLRAHYAELLDGPELPALADITNATTRGPNPLELNRYRYAYGPLLLVALEREIGTAAMGRALGSLLGRPPGARLDYSDLKMAVLAAGIPSRAWDRFEQRCIRSSPRAECLASFASAR
jgi:hypothetical protein